MNMLENNTNII